MKFRQRLIEIIRGADLKKYLLIVLFCFLAAIIIGVFTGLDSEKSTSQSRENSPQSTLESAYQDVKWGLNVQKNLKVLKSDFSNISSATNKSDYNALAEAARYEINNTQNAIEENDQYRVSSKLIEPQKEWRAALQDFNSAGTFLLEGANEAKSGRNGLENFKKAAALSSSGTVHMKKVSEALGINESFT